MVLDVKQSFIAYRCPHCRYAVYGIVGEFAMNAGRMLMGHETYPLAIAKNAVV